LHHAYTLLHLLEDMKSNESADSAALSRELTDYAAGVADTFGLSTAAIIALAREEHPGRPLTRLHFQAIIRALHRAGPPKCQRRLRQLPLEI
jgi:hypothetical protein